MIPPSRLQGTPGYGVRRVCAAILLVVAQTVWAETGDPPAQATDPVVQRDGFLLRRLRKMEPAKPGPITANERFHEYLWGTLGPVPVFTKFVTAGISQGLDSPPEWGQGSEGYFKRFGNNLANDSVRRSLTYGVASLLHEDNRYFASGKSRIWARIEHAMESSVTARYRADRERISVSALTGAVGAALISRAWAPPSWQTPGSVGRTIVYSIAGQAGMNVFREFLPDLIRHFEKPKPLQPTRPAGSGSPWLRGS
jgi:hypothetical protein